MLYFEILRVALGSLRANPMRSVLTMLGIIIGVAAVITMVALGSGAQAQVEQQISSLGTNLLNVRQGWGRFPGGGGGGGGARSRADTLTIDDARALQESVSSATEVVPEMSSDAQIENGNVNVNVQVVGTWANWAEVNNWEIEQGRFFTQVEAEGRRRVAVLGRELADQLFRPGEDPVGSEINVRGIRFEVLGVLKAKGGGFGGRNEDERAVIPLSTAQWRVFGRDRLSNITVKAAGEDLITMAMAEIETVMRRRHRLRPDQENDFQISRNTQFLELFQENQQTFTYLLAGIAAVSLVVGGIGIMNIMLVSVTERTKEIGIRKAIGARRSSVQLQFLIEAVVLSCVGGALGIALAMFAADFLGQRFGWQMIVPPDAVALSFGFAAVIGIVFGFYPAMRASRLDPIVALRYE